MSGCMSKRANEEKWRKTSGVSGLWGLQWSRKNRGMMRGAVAMNSEGANVKRARMVIWKAGDIRMPCRHMKIQGMQKA